MDEKTQITPYGLSVRKGFYKKLHPEGKRCIPQIILDNIILMKESISDVILCGSKFGGVFAVLALYDILAYGSNNLSKLNISLRVITSYTSKALLPISPHSDNRASSLLKKGTDIIFDDAEEEYSDAESELGSDSRLVPRLPNLSKISSSPSTVLTN